MDDWLYFNQIYFSISNSCGYRTREVHFAMIFVFNDQFSSQIATWTEKSWKLTLQPNYIDGAFAATLLHPTSSSVISITIVNFIAWNFLKFSGYIAHQLLNNFIPRGDTVLFLQKIIAMISGFHIPDHPCNLTLKVTLVWVRKNVWIYYFKVWAKK